MRTVMTELVITVEALLNEGLTPHRIAVDVAEEYGICYEDAAKLIAPIAELHKEIVGMFS